MQKPFKFPRIRPFSILYYAPNRTAVVFYYKSGHVTNFSEKFLAYHLLDFMAEEFWDDASGSYPDKFLGEQFLLTRPYLGSGIAPFMLESFFQSGVLPDGVYSFGDLMAESGTVKLDFLLYDKFFEENSEIYSHDEYLAALNQSFLGAPPTDFYYKIKRPNFSTGKNEVIPLRSVSEIRETMNLNSKNVVTYYNNQFDADFPLLSSNEATVSQMMNYFDKISKNFKHRSKLAVKKEIEQAILTSLGRRMSVIVASSVWFGDWLDGVVYGKGGGHAMVIVGYQKRGDRLVFKLRNSWGKDRLVDEYIPVRFDFF